LSAVLSVVCVLVAAGFIVYQAMDFDPVPQQTHAPPPKTAQDLMRAVSPEYESMRSQEELADLQRSTGDWQDRNRWRTQVAIGALIASVIFGICHRAGLTIRVPVDAEKASKGGNNPSV